MNVNGVLFSDEENLEMAEKISEEKKRKNLSDKDAVIMGEKMWEEFLNKKRKQQANNNR
jgi:dihydrofolate reductase